MMGMTVQAVRVLLATAMIESSSSSLVTSPSSLSFSALGEIFRNWERNIARPWPAWKLPEHWRVSPWPAAARISSPPPPPGSSPALQSADQPEQSKPDWLHGRSNLASPWRLPELPVILACPLPVWNLHLVMFALTRVKICTHWSTCTAYRSQDWSNDSKVASLTCWRLVLDQKYLWYLQSPTLPPR